jgi:hypothetical protein
MLIKSGLLCSLSTDDLALSEEYFKTCRRISRRIRRIIRDYKKKVRGGSE